MSMPGERMSQISHVRPLCRCDVGIGAHQQFLKVGMLRVGRPHLGAGDDDVVAVDHAAGRERREIGAGVRFGEALTPQRFAGQNPRQVVGFLRLGPAGDQRRSGMHERDVGRVDVVRRARARQLLVPDDLLQARSGPSPPILLRPGDAGPAMLVKLALPVAVELRRSAAVRGPGVASAHWPRASSRARARNSRSASE